MQDANPEHVARRSKTSLRDARRLSSLVTRLLKAELRTTPVSLRAAFLGFPSFPPFDVAAGPSVGFGLMTTVLFEVHVDSPA